MNNKDMILEMLQMQRVLDNSIYSEHGVMFSLSKCRRALIDEIGEFNHEDKKSWCWWKKSQADVDYDKLLEEFVDILHFALSIYYHWMDWCEYKDEDYRFNIQFLSNEFKKDDIACQLADIVGEKSMILEKLFYIGEEFGFTIEQVYEAYKKKNQVNFERLANGY